MNTKALRQKILDLAIRGKLVPQDPNDEPASVLLERIRAEKERLIKEGKIKRPKKSASSDTPHYENVPFDVPSSWKLCKVEQIVEDLKYGTSEKSSKYGKIAVLRMGNITNIGTIDYDNLAYTSNEDDMREYELRIGDLLFNRTNSSEWVGKTAIYKGEKISIFAGYLIRLRPLFINSEYLNAVMNSHYYRLWCNEVKTDAVNQSNINAQKLSQLSIPIPPLAEQNRIVAEIEKWFTLIDEIEKGQTDLATLIEQAKSKVLDLAIHGKLVSQDPTDEPAIDLLRRINPDFQPCDKSQYEQLPQGWYVTELGKVCQLNNGDKENGQHIYFDAKCLRGKTRGEVMTSGNLVRKGDYVILVDGENSGEVFVIHEDGYMGSTFKRLIMADAVHYPYVLYFIMFYKKMLRNSKKGAAIPHLNKELFKSLKIGIPPFAEQQRIVNHITSIFATLDSISQSLTD